MYDYLFELCSTLATQCPDVMVKMFAYYSGMTRKPPTLPAGKAFPKNLIVWFCTVEEALNVDWNHPLNTSRSLYDDLLNWRKLTPHLWTWCYPNQYGNVGAGYLPSGVVERLVTDIRLMKQAGCEGVYYEFDSPSVAGGNGFTELQIYLYCKLTQDVNSDVPALITEFTDYQYGAAAPLVRKYRDELEAAQRALKVPMTMWPSVLDFYGQHAYLSLENILRWQGYFDRMEKDVAADARRLANVRRLRRALEFATLARWNELANKHPGIFTDYRVHEGRLGKMSAGEKAVVDDFETFIKIGGKAKPLPPPFDGMAPARVQRFIPINGRGNKHVIEDDAAFGYAATVDLPDFPFNFGFYQQDTKKAGPQRTLKAGDIKPNTYQLHKLGEIEVTPSCLVWFSAKSWGTSLDVGNRLYEAGADNAHDVYVSLKFSGPSYGGKEKEDQVLCDQIIFVKKPAKQ